LPSNLLKFSNLKRVCIKGLFFWELCMDQIPPSVEYLDLRKQTSLSGCCMKGIDKLVNLKELRVDVNYRDLENPERLTDYMPLHPLEGLFVTFYIEKFYKNTKRNQRKLLQHPWMVCVKKNNLLFHPDEQGYIERISFVIRSKCTKEQYNEMRSILRSIRELEIQKDKDKEQKEEKTAT